jgi:Putative lumazine-binding
LVRGGDEPEVRMSACRSGSAHASRRESSDDLDPDVLDTTRGRTAVTDVFGGAATVTLVAADGIDYLHMAKWNGEWKIVNVLWEWKPAAQ